MIRFEDVSVRYPGGDHAVLDGTAPRFLALPMLGIGVAAAVAGLLSAGRRVQRSRYRPDPWRSPEWLTTLSGAVAAATVLAVASSDAADVLMPAPTGLPSLPVVAAAGVLVAILPAWLTPTTPRARAATARTPDARAAQLKDVA